MGRGPAWVVVENMALIKAWLFETNNPILGTDKSGKEFWGKGAHVVEAPAAEHDGRGGQGGAGPAWIRCAPRAEGEDGGWGHEGF